MVASGRLHNLIHLMLTVSVLLIPVSSSAETQSEFAQRIKAALQSPAKAAALFVMMLARAWR